MALISERGAAKLFGKESPVGKEVDSSMDREILVNLGNTSLNNTGEWAYYCYVRTSDRDGLQSVLDTYAYEMSGGNEKAGFRRKATAPPPSPSFPSPCSF